MQHPRRLGRGTRLGLAALAVVAFGALYSPPPGTVAGYSRPAAPQRPSWHPGYAAAFPGCARPHGQLGGSVLLAAPDGIPHRVPLDRAWQLTHRPGNTLLVVAVCS